MLAKVLMGLCVGLVGAYAYVEVSERTASRAAFVHFEPVFEPNLTTREAVASIVSDTSDATDAVRPELLPETQAMLAMQPAIDLLVGQSSSGSAYALPLTYATSTDLQTGSIETDQNEIAGSTGLVTDTTSSVRPAEATTTGSFLAATDPLPTENKLEQDSVVTAKQIPSTTEEKSEGSSMTARMVTVDVGMVALRSAPTTSSLINGTARRGDILSAFQIDGSTWVLVQDVRSGAIGYLPRTVIKDVLQ